MMLPYWGGIIHQAAFLVPSFSTDLQYCDPTGRNALIARGWSITDGGAACPTTTTWDGASWSAGAPTSGVNAIIAGDYNASTNGNISCLDLTVNATFTLIIPTGSNVTIAEDLINSGTISVREEGSLIQTLYSPANSGTGTYQLQRTGPDRDTQFNYWSSPVSGITLNDAFSTNAQFFYSYNAATQTWTSETTATNMTTGVGYALTGTAPAIINTTITRGFSNTAGFHSGTYDISLSYSNDGNTDNDWNLVGNPYPSGLSVDSLLKRNYANGGGTIANAVYLWNSDGNDIGATNSDYAIMNTAGVAQGGAGTAPTSTNIASGQGFFVQAINSGSISFENNMRNSTNNTFLRTANSKQDWNRAWIGVTLRNGSALIASNEVLIGFMPDASLGQDQYDAKKFVGNEYISFYSQATHSSKLAIQGLPKLVDQEQVLPLGLETETAGTYTFNINHLDQFEEIDLFLIDAVTGVVTDLRSEIYQVDLAAGNYTNRFSIRFSPAKVTSIEEEIEEPLKADLFGGFGKVYVRFAQTQKNPSTINIYDAMGKVIYTGTHNEQGQFSIPVQQAGLYIIRLVNKFGTISQQVLIR